ncbi:class I SAM-dependent methyltransferase [Pseudomaricurvus sp.]|uniref:class I SAM-dependent methyltransferase n=1 Tax=Pseudomaricurvus sp. TaxID=2004510 RepID=UPI003F6C4925
MSIDKKQQWSNYWRQGHLTSLPCGFSSNYDGEFLRFWEEQFGLLAQGSCVLDVCSGNGSIALLAQDYSERAKLDLKVNAVDAADIDISALIQKNPAFSRRLKAITFIPNTLFENLSEERDSADLITSQYGIEYTDWNISAKKIYRLLRPGGYFSLICHTFDSTIMTQMELQQHDYAALMNLDIFSREIEFEHSHDFPEQFVKQLDHALDAIYAIFKQARTSDLLSKVGTELEAIRRETMHDFSQGFQRFTQFQRGIHISYATASDLVTVNRKLEQSPEWFEVFMDKGLDLIKSGDVHYHTSEKAGKFYQFRKPH